MINFKASYINSTTIKRINQPQTTDKVVSFVELSPQSMSDVKAIRTLSYCWDDNKSFAGDLYNNLRDCRLYSDDSGQKFYAITQQRNNFEKLDSDEILAVAQIHDRDDIHLDLLQVDPANNNDVYLREFCYVGTAMLNCLKKLFPDKDITLKSVNSAIEFYLKNGFNRIGDSSHFIFKHKVL